ANNTPGTLDVPPFTAGGAADSFFDVFMTVQVGVNGPIYHNGTPFHMTAVIHHKPPIGGDVYVNPFTQPIPLLDANGNPTGLSVIREVHTPVPTNASNCTVSITCPTNMTVSSCTASAVVTFTVTGSSSCGSNVTVTCAPPSGS